MNLDPIDDISRKAVMPVRSTSSPLFGVNIVNSSMSFLEKWNIVAPYDGVFKDNGIKRTYVADSAADSREIT